MKKKHNQNQDPGNISDLFQKKDVIEEIFLQIKLTLPVVLTLTLRKSIDIVPVIFVGHLGMQYLSAAGLATVTANVTGNSVLIGLAGAYFDLIRMVEVSQQVSIFLAIALSFYSFILN